MRLEAEGLAAIRGGRTLFRDLSFAASGGEAVLISGPNGSGKTTLLRVLAGLLAPSAGRVVLAGSEDPVSEAVHFIGHLDALKGMLPPEENLTFHKNLFGGTGETVEAALTRVGLGALSRVPAGILSAGQRRRAALARLLVSHRPIWLLDEPANAIDTAGQKLLAALMQEHRAGGGIVVAATHMRIELPGATGISLGEKS